MTMHQSLTSKYSGASARHRQWTADIKRRARAKRITAKYKPLTLTDKQQAQVRAALWDKVGNALNSHQVACRLGLTHSAVAEYMKGL